MTSSTKDWSQQVEHMQVPKGRDQVSGGVSVPCLKNSNGSEIPLLIHNNSQYSAPAEKASLLNSYFCEQSNIDDSHASLPTSVPSNTALNNIELTDSDVEDVIKLLNTNTAYDPDLVNPRFLKEGSKILSNHLSRVFNLSLCTSHFPTVWKQANVVPVFKKGKNRGLQL